MSVFVRLLGPVDVMLEDTVRPVPGLRRKAVLARLALRPGEVVSTDLLIDAVWDGQPPATAVNTLQRHVSYLRRILGAPDAIRAQAPGYLLGVTATDLRQAEDLIERGRGAATPADGLAALEQALELWRGQPLIDVAALSWFSHEADRLERMRRAAEQAAVECRLALGQHATLIPELAKLCEQRPFDEDQHGQLMVALYRGGRQAEALSVFHQLRARLMDELGIDPSGPIRDLHAAILRQDPGLDLPPAPASPGPPVSGSTHLIERAEETALIDQALSRALDSRTGRILIFEGPAGIGKTSLLDLARKRGSVLGYTVVSARGTDLETDYGWGCARQLFHRYGEAESAISPFPPADQEASGGEYQPITSLFWLACDLASRNPLMIVLDDLQWADTPSVQFLAFLASRLDALRIVIVLGLRPGYERIGRFVSSIAGLPYSSTAVPRPLSPQGCVELLAEVIDTPDPELADRCQALTRGNPFLMKELALSLSAAGGDLTKALPEGSPTVHRFVARQLRYLPPFSVEVAQALAVLGDGTGSDWLATMTRTSAQDALHALPPLVSSQLVVAEGIPVRFSFGHPLIRDSVYESIPAAQRTELHLRAAHAAMGAHDPIRAATHLLRVPPGYGTYDPIPILAEAADISLAKGSVNSAVTFLRRIMEADLGERRTEMLTRLGSVEALVDPSSAIEHLSEALARSPGPEARARVACGLASTLWIAGRPREAARVCLAALERDRGIADDTRQFLRGCLAMVAYGTRHGTDLIGLIDTYQDETTGASIGGRVLDAGMALHHMHQNRRDDAERRALSALAGDRLIHEPMAAGASLTCAWYALVPCDSPALLPSIENALDHNRRSGSLSGLSGALYLRSEAMYAQGHLRDALSDAWEAWEVSDIAGVRLGGSFIASVLLRTLAARGEFDRAVEILRQTKARHATGVTPVLYAPGEIALHLAMGQTRRALAAALATRDQCAGRIFNPVVSDWRAPLVRCYSLLGREDEARATAEELLSASREWGTARAVGRALRHAAVVESGTRELELLEESVRLLDTTKAALEQATSLYAFGNALNRCGHPVEAWRRLGAAFDLAEFCGARLLRDAIGSALRRAGEAPLTPAVMAALSPTETKVADLAGRGMSAREIAEELYLTVETVRQRLAVIERKRAGTSGPSAAR
ncbi:AAA family ATPase [Frankia sp. CNm7]|uniref:AAA family ATPase n=1 Tax=Frankia nepalensis TaxID=1836974 RepID=A0A937RJG3_9ACTN|nr:BTAD domain-containing putative transcriptional regulator [Frankia nepalensis]MBL7498858.1 AAA family ATPase [Frankia nepalensis]MBL7513690.1 AAA family ATPase [Frankia nepalensis]MBL7524155.1 AAA family ATPase [Frankia nepalensis]MBL7631362.1 AAA family ATPase [Frankia nepalensis]